MNTSHHETGEMRNRLGALLTATAPSGPELADGRAAQLSQLLARQVVEADRGFQGRMRGLRRRQKVAAVAAAAAIVFVPTGAWAAHRFLAQTGVFGVDQPGGLQDSSELINMCARDFGRYVATLAPTPTELPAPPGHRWADYAAKVAATEVRGAGCLTAAEATQQASSLRLSIVMMADGDWGCALVSASRAGDAAGEQTARAAMNRFNAEARRVAPDSGAGYPPDTFLANSRLPEFTGCAK